MKQGSDSEEVRDILSIKQENFLRFYIVNDELRGNATLSYAEAYGYDLDTLDKTGKRDLKTGILLEPSEFTRAYNTCSQLASRLLRNVKVQRRRVEILNEVL